MRPLQIGLALPLLEAPATGEAPRWQAIRTMARRAEELRFDTVWLADELLWRVADWPGPRGWWECVAMAGAVAATTERIEIGSWVLSALHRNPALTAKVAETIDEISGGRFLLGFGAGHAGSQGAAFGYPLDRTIGRYEEALQVLVPLLRDGQVTFAGEFHSAKDLEQRPRGPRPGRIPIVLGAHGQRTMRLAVQHADIWSCYATESSLPDAFAGYVHLLDEACEQAGRDPASIGRSVGVVVEPTAEHTAEASGLGVPISGEPDAIAETFRALGEMGFTRAEIIPWPPSPEAIELLGVVLDRLDG
jgi:alkanesulfonate monooxygenase SsuD/methylene tetrahydromethanopterin reductase-like flavin-dependent oxidoreductase (luciferase family)